MGAPLLDEDELVDDDDVVALPPPLPPVDEVSGLLLEQATSGAKARNASVAKRIRDR
jgi:hypothetical protein